MLFIILLFITSICGDSHEKSKFLKEYGDLYGYGGRIDAIYEREIAPRLPSPETHYLDWTAAALYLNSQVQDSMKDLKSNLYGNPHSAHASSALTTAKIEQLREDLLAYFGADPEEYTLCFVRSATGALDYIGQMFPWSKNSRYVHSRSNHNSVLGIREYARKAGGLTSAIDEGEIDQWLQEDSEEESDEGEGEGEGGGSASSPSYSLFAYPLYENFAGSIYPRSWADSIRRKPTRKGRRWLVLVDTAAYVPHHHLNLSAHNFKPDFAVISFYKLFGYPSGVGALLIRKDIEPLMSKTYFAGGSVFTATSGIEWHLTQPFPRILEDGTVPYLDILALRSGLEAIHSLGGIDRVHDHTKSLGQYLYLQLSSLKHSNGMPIVRVFGRWAEQEDIRKKGVAEVQGPTINFQLLNPSSDVLSYKHAEQLLSNEGLHIRSGCTCNPGACYSYLGILDSEVRDLAEKRAKEAPADWEDKWEWIDVEREVEGVRREVRLPLGSLRASLGYMSRWEDAHSLVDFINTTYRDQQVDPPTLEISADKIGSERRQLSFPGHQKELHHTCAC